MRLKKIERLTLVLLTLVFSIVRPVTGQTKTPAQPNNNSNEDTILQQIERLPTGSVQVDIPHAMKAGQTQRVTVRVSRESSEIAFPNASGEVRIVKVGDIVKATLLFDEIDSFRVSELTNSTQIIAGKSFAEWDWDVTPLTTGKHSLRVILSVVVKVANRGELSFVLPIIERQVEVESSYLYLASRISSGIYVLILLAIVAAYFLLARTSTQGGRRVRGYAKLLALLTEYVANVSPDKPAKEDTRNE
jgi:hypothetical protein